MSIKSTIAAAVALSLAAVSATAGGYDAEIVEAPVIVAEPVQTGSMGSLGGAAPLLIALGVIAVAVAVSNSNDDDNGNGNNTGGGNGGVNGTGTGGGLN